MSMPMDAARKVADAVLYEGYLLYPYRASATKNRMRWQFGVLVPKGYAATGEPSANVTECLLETAAGTSGSSGGGGRGGGGGGGDAEVTVRLRFLHVLSRTVEQADGELFQPVDRLAVDDTTYITFEEADEREQETAFPLAMLLDEAQTVAVDIPGDRADQPIRSRNGRRLGRVVLEHRPLKAAMRLSAERVPGPYGLVKLRVEVENRSAWERPDAPREQALRRSLISTHLLLGVSRAAFVSLLDPPEWARPAVEMCKNEHTWPVLVGEDTRRDAMLSSPIILSDHPAVAAESPGDLFDATEIDELLSLCTMSLTDEEKQEACRTDRRAAEIIDRIGTLPPELVERLHGAIRRIGATPTVIPPDGESPPKPPAALAPSESSASPASSTVPGSPMFPGLPPASPYKAPWWDPGVDADVSPDTDSVMVGDVPVARGSRVRLSPGKRRADAYDMFLLGRTATVEAVLHDVDGLVHLAVTLEDDLGADLHRSHGRYLYFGPDEVEPLCES
ncbi:hypothetical protein SAMN05421505_13240 [Sinosporangium album]|uniref:Uncharacterized protein n=1 Tax=Sinosporangium album TaxID=504805 RepID=A0A1G8HIF8_9ACTN|nr:hypothetical protein [Sinosporangium album]SDI06281.1 hypothetical protein SAMN05421505_13240 [Sinosporangium album]